MVSRQGRELMNRVSLYEERRTTGQGRRALVPGAPSEPQHVDLLKECRVEVHEHLQGCLPQATVARRLSANPAISNSDAGQRCGKLIPRSWWRPMSLTQWPMCPSATSLAGPKRGQPRRGRRFPVAISGHVLRFARRGFFCGASAGPLASPTGAREVKLGPAAVVQFVQTAPPNAARHRRPSHHLLRP